MKKTLIRILAAPIKWIFKLLLNALTGFLLLLLKKDRYPELQAILDHFMSRVKEYKGIGVARVTSAVELRDDQKKEIENKLISTTGYNRMEMHFEKDEELIGGLVIRKRELIA